MKIFTIGFTGKSAEDFFTLLKKSGAKKLIDIRINRNSQLAGFAKERDLEFLLSELAGVSYQVNEELAPTKEMLASYRDKKTNWDQYSQDYNALIADRTVLKNLDKKYFEDSILLCSENEPEKCHRTLLANLLKKMFPDLEIIHLS
jgi:uncharacterized protein (DUF488 family)